jgi:tape measure domain-containing protein
VANNINIGIRQTGARTVARQLHSILDAAQNTTRGLRLLQNALFVLGGAGIIRSLQRTVDMLTGYENRLKLVTNSAEQLNQVSTELFAISERTRTSFNATADVYARTALSVRELGISQQETLQFTESLNKAVILSGPSAREASAAMIQLGQGLASNRLSGDELRSVLEQLPFVADVIANSLGITRGQLRQFGKDGKLTGETVLKAFRDAREEIAEKFARTLPTIEQALSVFTTAWLRLLDTIDDTTGASEAVAKAIIGVANNMDVLVGSATVLTGALAGLSLALLARNFFFLGAAVRFAAAAFLILAANPLVALLTGIGALVGFIVTFGSELKITEDGLVSLKDAAIEAFGLFLEVAAPVFDQIVKGFQLILGAGLIVWDSIGGAVSDFFLLLGLVAKKTINLLVGLFLGSRNAIILIFDKLGPALSDVFATAFTEAVNIVQDSVNFILRQIKALFDAVDDLSESAGLGRIFGDSLEGVSADLGRFKIKATGAGAEFADEFNKGFSDALSRDFVGETGEALGNFADEAIRRARRSGFSTVTETDLSTVGDKPPAEAAGAEKLATIIQRLENQNALLRVQGLEREKLSAIQRAELSLKRELSEEERRIITGLVEENSLLEAQSDILGGLRNPAEQYLNSQRALITLLADGKITLEEFNQQLENVRLTFLKSQDD